MKHTFTAIIHEGRGGGAYAEVPFDVEQTFGTKQPQVKATMEGETFPTRLIRMGMPCHIVGVPKALRVKSGKDVGDTIAITVEADHTPREVIVPPDLAKALKTDKPAREFFDSLSYTHRNEYVRWIQEAKKEETRTRRVTRTLEMLKENKRGV